MTVVAVPVVGPDTGPRMPPPDPSHCDDTDEALMLAYAHGDATAFERLYTRHKGPTYRYFLRHTSERATADELHQDTWMKVVGARDGYLVTASFRTWLYTLARHRLVDHWRTRRGAILTSLDEDRATNALEESGAGDGGHRSSDPLDQVIDAQSATRLLAALADVPGPQRDAFLLHVEGGLSLVEIAAMTGMPVEAIKSRLRYAYRRLRAALEDLQ